MQRKKIEAWLNKDQKLQDLINDIETSGKSSQGKAEIAFEKFCTMYNIPKMPNDINEDDENINLRSLFEEHALVKYLSDGSEDPRSMVLSATYNLLNKLGVDYLAVAEKEFGKNIPKKCRIGIKGDGYNGAVVFLQRESKSWIDLGCKIMRQIN